MATKTYTEFVKDQVVEGFESGFKFEDFKKGDSVYFFHSTRPIDEPVLIEGKIFKTERALNAVGKDTIRNVEIVFTNDGREQLFVVHGHTQIKYFIFKKVEVEQPELEIESDPVETQDEIVGETVIVERAMSVKNPKVKEYLEKGYQWVGKEWNAAKNMYIATLVRGA